MLDKDNIIAIIEEGYDLFENIFYDDLQDGICHNCGHIQPNVEPDARRYLCKNCNEHEVYGIEETILTLEG